MMGHVLFVWPLLTRQRTTNYATGLNVIGQVVGRIGWNARKCVVSYEIDSKTYKMTRYIKDAKPLDEVELIYLVGYPKSATVDTDKRFRGFILALLIILMQVFGITARTRCGRLPLGLDHVTFSVNRELHMCIYRFVHILLPFEEKSLLRS